MDTIGRPRTVFDRIPEYFVERYDDEIQAWGANLRKIGRIKSFILREGTLADLSPDPDMGAVLIQVKLRMEYARFTHTVNVFPDSDADEEKIRKHCEKMQRAGVPARGRLVEPIRPGLPFMPDRYN
jgi:hypothetical protein